VARLPQRCARLKKFGAVSSARGRARLAGGSIARHHCGLNARTERSYRKLAAFTRGGGVKGENSLQPRGVCGRAFVEVTVGAASSQKVVLSCVAALTRAACRSRVAHRPKARGWRAVGPWWYVSCQIRKRSIMRNQSRRTGA